MLVIFTISFQFLGNMDLQLQQFQREISPNLVDFLLSQIHQKLLYITRGHRTLFSRII